MRAWTSAENATGEVLAPGLAGKLICTGLLNGDMPLIRYDLGDRGALGLPGPACACGRALPRMQSLEGRSDDVVVTPGGRRIGRLDPVFKEDLPIREAQIVQVAIDRVSVRVVPAPGFGEASARLITARLLERLGPEMAASVEVVPRIPRTSAGKFRAVIRAFDQPRESAL